MCVCTERKNNNIQLIYHVESNQWPYIQPQGKGTPAHADLIPTDLLLEFLPFKVPGLVLKRVIMIIFNKKIFFL